MSSTTIVRLLKRPLVKGGQGDPSESQYAYRLRADDGSETGATWLAAENSDLTVNVGDVIRIRLGIDALNDPSAAQYQLGVKESADTAYYRVQNP